MQLSVALFLVISAAVLVSSHPVGEEQDSKAATGTTLVRDKRTIGILRDLFPNFSQMIDRKIQMLTRFIFRIVGRLVLQGGGGGGGGGGGDDDRRVQITLPTYPPDELDDEDEDSTGASTTSEAEPTTNADEENAVGGDSRKREVRAKRDAEEEEEEEEDDLEPEATGDNEVNDNEAEGTNGEAADEDDPRNKRFLNFNLGASASTDGSAGSGGGSGNFLFDIIRLVAGSGNTQSGDAQHAALEEGKDDAAYGVGVPGPLTRLFVVANKGVAALIQDLILRLAQTSERIVNFKARLITSII